MDVKRIALTSLSLHSFRNYASLRLETQGNSVVLVGPNGAGKTNILEAVSLLFPGRGLRRARLSELDCQHHSSPWTIAGRVRGLQGEVTLGTGRIAAAAPEAETDRRAVRIDGRDARSHNELAEHTAMLWLTPQMDLVWQEGSSGKRRLLDRLTYAFDPAHAACVSSFEQAMRERNKLLQQPPFDVHWLEALERRMAENAAAIASARLATVESLSHVMEESTRSFPRARLTISGFVEDRLKAGESALSVEEKYAHTLQFERALDAAAGRTLTGPHKSILTIRHISKNMDAEFCSTGEQKALLLSLTLAQARACARWKGLVPLLLLDEVAAHLDPLRRGELFEETHDLGAQVWMTGTDAALFHELQTPALRLCVEQAQVTALDEQG